MGIGIGFIYFIFKLKVGYLPIISLSIIIIFLLFILYTLNFGISISKKTAKSIEDTKNRPSYSEDKITIDIPILEKTIVLYWDYIEAIFLLNKPPLDGEYHNFEYSIILNSQPTMIPYNIQSWYNKTSILSKTKSKGLPLIKINDYSNVDFHTFNESINKYLLNANKDSSKYLKLKFGNEIQNIKSINETKVVIEKPLKTIGFYKIFDRENKLSDDRLNMFRQEIDNKN